MKTIHVLLTKTIYKQLLYTVLSTQYCHKGCAQEANQLQLPAIGGSERGTYYVLPHQIIYSYNLQITKNLTLYRLSVSCHGTL